MHWLAEGNAYLEYIPGWLKMAAGYGIALGAAATGWITFWKKIGRPVKLFFVRIGTNVHELVERFKTLIEKIDFEFDSEQPGSMKAKVARLDEGHGKLNERLTDIEKWQAREVKHLVDNDLQHSMLKKEAAERLGEDPASWNPERK